MDISYFLSCLKIWEEWPFWKWFVFMHHNMESLPFGRTQISSASPQDETQTEVLKLSGSCQRRLERDKIHNFNHNFVSWWISCPFSHLFPLLPSPLWCTHSYSPFLPSVSAVRQCQTQGQSQRESCPVLDGANSIMRSSLLCISLCCSYQSWMSFLCFFSPSSPGPFNFSSVWI